METNKDFAAQVAANDKAAQHAQEIKNSRIGGLGGSDASIVLKIGQGGLATLSATDHKRLAIMLGMCEQDDWNGNAYTNAGHAFEDWVETSMPWNGTTFEREKVLTQPLAKNFKVFAHADYVTDSGTVVECKFVQSTTDKCESKHWAQLQWYYMLGAPQVHLCHGTGTADPFEVWETNVRPVERDEETIKYLLAGLQTLDEAIGGGWKPEIVEKVSVADVPEVVAEAFMKLAEANAKKKAIEEEEAAAKAILIEYLEGYQLNGIVSADGSKHQVLYSKGGITKTFDTGALAKDYPQIDLGKYYKQTKRKASVTFR